MNGESTGVWTRRSALRIAVLVRSVAVGGLLLSGFSMCTQRHAVVHQVAIRNFAYLPAHITVAAGDTLVWRNSDILPHTVTARDSAWDSGSMAVDSAWRFVAQSVGTYTYFCIFHPNMKGTINVY